MSTPNLLTFYLGMSFKEQVRCPSLFGIVNASCRYLVTQTKWK